MPGPPPGEGMDPGFQCRTEDVANNPFPTRGTGTGEDQTYQFTIGPTKMNLTWMRRLGRETDLSDIRNGIQDSPKAIYRHSSETIVQCPLGKTSQK